MPSPELDSKIYKLNFKTALESLTVRPQMKLCMNKQCRAMFLVMGKRIGQTVECPECHAKYVLRQEVILKTVLDPVEAV